MTTKSDAELKRVWEEAIKRACVTTDIGDLVKAGDFAGAARLLRARGFLVPSYEDDNE